MAANPTAPDPRSTAPDPRSTAHDPLSAAPDPFAVVVVLSGGMDSTTLMAHYAALRFDLTALTVDYGQRHSKEIDSAREIAAHYGARHHVVDLRGFGALLSGSALTDASVEVPDGHYAEESMRSTVVPNRNAVLANVAVSIGVAHRAATVALGMHAGDHFVYPDCRPQFVESLRELVAVANEGFAAPRVEAPFLGWSKADIATHGTRLRAPLERSWSCYKGGELHCGTCGTCYERREAFREAGAEDPTAYLDSVTEYATP